MDSYQIFVTLKFSIWKIILIEYNNKYMNETELTPQSPFNDIYPLTGQIWDTLSIKKNNTHKWLQSIKWVKIHEFTVII